ncbi:hypothetical protein LguiB_013043 [Lonicera macranthoides]
MEEDLLDVMLYLQKEDRGTTLLSVDKIKAQVICWAKRMRMNSIGFDNDNNAVSEASSTLHLERSTY